MSLSMWEIDRLLKTAAQTPGQQNADKFLRAVTPEDIERLMRADEDTSHGNLIGAPTGGPVHVPNQYMDSDYPESGYNRPDRRYEDVAGEYGHRPGEEHPELQSEYTLSDPRNYRLRNPFDMFGDNDDEEEPDEPEWNTYHVGVRPRGTSQTPTEVRVHRLEQPYESEPDEAHVQLMLEHPENFHEDNPNRSHDIMYVHPEHDHDRWRSNIDQEEQQFQRIAPSGLRRESPDFVGHRAYRQDMPNGVVHRLWHSGYSSNGPGWHTSRYDPRHERDQQSLPWTEHPDSHSEDSLGEALAQVERNKAHVDPRTSTREVTSAAAKPKPKKPREPEEVWRDVHKHPEGVPGGMGKSPEHHLRGRGWQGHQINEGSGKKTIQYRNQGHPDFVISYGGGTSQKPDHNFRVLYMGGNTNIPKVTRAYSVAEAMNKVEELHQLHNGLVVQPMTHGAAAAQTPPSQQKPVLPVTPKPAPHRDMTQADSFPRFPDRPQGVSEAWNDRHEKQLKEIPDPPEFKPTPPPPLAPTSTTKSQTKIKYAGLTGLVLALHRAEQETWEEA